MPYPHRRVLVGLAIAVGLLAMGAVALRPRAASLNGAKARLPLLVADLEPSPTRPATRRSASLPLVVVDPEPSPMPTATATGTPTSTPTRTLTPTPTATPSPQATPDGQPRQARVPILMYHYVSDPPAGADAYRLDLSVDPQQFEAQLAHLQAAGYESITLGDLVRHLAAGEPLPPRPVVLTFDDGYVDNYLYAFPLLRQYGFRGTFFVVTRFLDEGRPGYLSWEQAGLMQAAGMDIEAHGVSHESLRRQSHEYLEREILGSRQAIEAHLQKPVRFFAYPFGHYDQQAIEVLRAGGYWGAVTTEAGVLHSSAAPFTLKRVRVHGGQGLDKFVATLDYYMQ